MNMKFESENIKLVEYRIGPSVEKGTMCKESIKEYFKGKTIFLTGGSGFIGKVLIETLLRSCPDLAKIYLLVRPKKGKMLYERVEQITSLCLFDRLKKKYPKNIEKIIPISGDTSQLGLGLSKEDRQLLLNEVQIFFHAAASVKFDDFLKDAIFTNIRSAREAALLALEIKKIEVFMHISTTYCNVNNKKVVEPKLYPAHGTWKDVILVAEKCDTETLNVVSQKFIGEFPNTYTYTKHLAEHCINDLLGEKVPTVLFRPSVVISSLVDPFQGWIDNFNGPVGLMIAGGSGLLRTGYADPNIVPDYIPVDNLAKCMVVAVWHKIYFGKKNELEIYNMSNHKLLPTKVKTLIEMGKTICWEIPLARRIWFPTSSITKNWYIYFLNVILFHMIPALFLDLFLWIAGYPPILFKIQRKIYIANMALSHFLLNEWDFLNTNTLALLDFIPKEEKEDFVFTIIPSTTKDLYNYYLTSANVGRQLLLKEDKEIAEKTLALTCRMYYLDRVCHWIFYGLMIWLIFFKINILALTWKVVCDYWESL